MSFGSRFVLPYQTVINNVGVPLPGAFLFFYVSGTDTPFNTYSDADLTTPNTNPVKANDAGMFPNIFLANINYKVVLTDADLVEQWTADPVATANTTTRTTTIVTTAGPFTLTTEQIFVLNKAAPSSTIINLPAVVTRLPSLTGDIDVYDWLGNAGGITINPNGTDKIMGANTAWTVLSGGSVQTGGSLHLIPCKDLHGWLVR